MPVLHQSHSTNPFFLRSKKGKWRRRQKKIWVNSASEASGNFFGVYFRERSEQKKIEVPSCQSCGGRARGPQQCPKPPTFFFFFLPRDFPFFFFFFRQTVRVLSLHPPLGILGVQKFFCTKPSEKSIPSFLPTQAVVARASRALLPDKVGRGVKIRGKMGKPGPDAMGFVKSWEAQKNFPAPVFFSHWGVFPRAKRAGKNFKVYLRERSERKITLSTHAYNEIHFHIITSLAFLELLKVATIAGSIPGTTFTHCECDSHRVVLGCVRCGADEKPENPC